MTEKKSILHSNGVNYILPFILITSCFALWGFANDITNPMVKAFSKIFRMSVTDGTLVQVAFYGGYFAMAFPAAMFIRRFSYKAGVMMGLGLYAVGAFLFYPAMLTGAYYPFLIAYFILTCGLSFLETSCNPYILSMGSEDTATQRLNLAQSFNPVGSLLGMWVAMTFIQARLNPLESDARASLSDAEFEAVRDADLSILITPYLIIGAVVLLMLALIWMMKMPKNGDKSHDVHFLASIGRKLLATLATAAALLTIGVMAFQDRTGMYCLVAVSACMSLMFPTIYGIALNGLGDDAKFGAAGLIMAILGGSVLPPLQARIIDCGTIFGYPAVNLYLALPLICFIVIVIYGSRRARN